jgi:hypothetical protein
MRTGIKKKKDNCVLDLSGERKKKTSNHLRQSDYHKPPHGREKERSVVDTDLGH